MRWLAGASLAAAGLGAPLGAQISPGPLSLPHAKLDGNEACLSCHSAEKGVDRALCLKCHVALADRIAAGRGPHARPDFVACAHCHPEHGGRTFQLIDWPGGRDHFDHRETGWTLEGKHVRIPCADCHKPDRVAPAVLRREPGLDPRRTFLGLTTGCVDCHVDPHRGTMTAATCTGCHDQESWKNVRGFDHSRTRYPLDGAHAKVKCLDCHKQPAPPPGQEGSAKTLLFAQFKAAGGRPACALCHRDPHQGRLGNACANCHSTTTFRSTSTATVRFDHDRTAYPLRGKHRNVECAKCHPAGRELRVPGFERCETCHRDPHLGQLRKVSTGGACADCHAVDGFAPARYGPREHEKARFPLAGAHLAVPCSACHRLVAPGALPRSARASMDFGGTARTRQFEFDRFRCKDCHRDPHGGELDRYAADKGCAACHDQNAWRPARFDHQQTRYPLRDAHLRVACEKCHPAASDGTRRFDGRPLDCAGCHKDVHAGQFVVAGNTDCARCHDERSFRPASRFQHAASRFPLDGRHVKVACAGCHPTESTPAGPVVRYRPRPVECAGCHGAKKAAA